MRACYSVREYNPWVSEGVSVAGLHGFFAVIEITKQGVFGVNSAKRSYLSVFLGVISLVLLSQISAFSQQFQPADISAVNIKNFSQMDDRFFRGGQPKED